MIKARPSKGERRIGITCCDEESPGPGIGDVSPRYSGDLPQEQDLLHQLFLSWSLLNESEAIIRSDADGTNYRLSQ